MAILVAGDTALYMSKYSFLWRREKNQIMLPMTTIAMASAMSVQLRMTRPIVTWFLCTTAKTDMKKVIRRKIPSTRPAVEMKLQRRVATDG